MNGALPHERSSSALFKNLLGHEYFLMPHYGKGNHFTPRVAQQDVPSAEASSQARSMLALFSDKGSSISLSSRNRKALKGSLKPNCC